VGAGRAAGNGPIAGVTGNRLPGQRLLAVCRCGWWRRRPGCVWRMRRGCLPQQLRWARCGTPRCEADLQAAERPWQCPGPEPQPVPPDQPLPLVV